MIFSFIFVGNTQLGSYCQNILNTQHNVWERRVGPFVSQPLLHGQTTPIGPPSWIRMGSPDYNKNFSSHLPRRQAVTHAYYV